jgi:hypothetical protein
MAPSLVVAALTPAKATDVQTNPSATPGVKRPRVIYVKSFSISATAAKSEESAGDERPHLLVDCEAASRTPSLVGTGTAARGYARKTAWTATDSAD